MAVLKSPFYISSRLMPAIKIGKTEINLEYSKKPGAGGRTRYHFVIELPGGRVVHGEDLQSGVGGGTLQQGFASLLSFLAAAGDGYAYEMRGGKSENASLFDHGVTEWAYQYNDELGMASLELEETPNLIDERPGAETRANPPADMRHLKPGHVSIESLEHPEWGTWGVREDQGGSYVIQGRSGQRMLDKSEAVKFWRVVEHGTKKNPAGGEWEVIVGNIGSVYLGNGTEAKRRFAEYRSQSKSGVGRAGGEDVTLMHHGEPVKEFIGKISQSASDNPAGGDKIKASEIIFHGRNAQGLSVFTCYDRGLGQFRTDARGAEARRLAKEYFNREAATTPGDYRAGEGWQHGKPLTQPGTGLRGMMRPGSIL